MTAPRAQRAGPGPPGVNPKTLSQWLKRLEGLGILKKTVASTMPPRIEYELTAAGAELDEVIGAIDRWSRRRIDALPVAVRL